jgi:hypothetical protein
MNLSELFQWLGYAPHAAQVVFHQSDARFKILIAGARFGKSLAAARDNLAETLTGRTKGWLVGPTFELSRPEFDYIRDDLQLALRAPMQLRRLPSALSVPWGAAVESHSAHMPQTLLGREVDWLILCEAAHIDREAFERFMRARLTTRTGRLTVGTSPRGHNWIHALYERGLENQPGWQSFRHATWENPLVSAEEVESARAALPAATFDEQFGGVFTSASGNVYREFQRGVHVEALRAPSGAIIYKAIDIGYTAPFACLWGALDHDNRLLILREHYAEHMSIPEHAQAIHAVDEEFVKLGCTIGPAWADPAAAGERRMLADHGVRTLAAEKHVSGGIEVVRGRLLTRQDRKPGLLIDDACANLLREIEGYEWQESSRGEKVPRKKDDHALDALRYLCVALARKVDWKNRGTLW